jgi:uncharacterized protein
MKGQKMRVLKTLLSAIAVTALLSGPVFAAPKAKGKTAATKKVKMINATPALWVVKDEDTTLYLFGTIHILKPNINWFNGPVKKAFDGSQELVIEMIEPPQDKTMPIIMQKAIDPDGPPLTQKLSPKTLVAYKKAMAENGIPVEQFEKFEPWFASIPLSLGPLLKKGYDPKSGVETVLQKAAVAQKKTRGELETFEQQMDFFDTMPEADQISFLESIVEDTEKSAAELDGVVMSWVKGDPLAIDRYMNEGLSKTPNLRKILLADRNANWANWIQKRLDKPGTVFIAVGAGHLAGADSVQALLETKGLKANRINR